jgi:cell division septation protein DedD
MAAKGSRHRFELSRLELAGVIVSTAAGLFVVFLLGLYAGRGMNERRLELTDAAVRLPVSEAEARSPGGDGEELTFYDTLARESAREPERAPTERVEPASPPADEPQARAAAGERAAEQAATTAAAPGAAAAPAPAAEPASKDRPPGLPEARVAVALAEPPTASAPPRAPGEWSVQVAATRDPRTADGIVQRLKGAGYDAYVLRLRRGGETFHRVRVGHYGSLDQAREAAARLRRLPGIQEAFVASD